MNRKLQTILALALAVASSGCQQAKTIHVQQTEEEAPRLAAVVRVSDPKAAPQLLSGFYALEANSWRWTGRNFAVLLRVPDGAASRGAALDLALSVPDVTIEKLKSVSLSATADGHPLPPQTYTTAGQFHYQRDIAPGMLANQSVRVEFHLDKAIPPSNGDKRELGLIVNSVGLEAK